MAKISMQDILDNARRAFFIRKEKPSLNDLESCCYLNDSGNKCAVGHSLPTGHRAQLCDHKFSDLVEGYPELWADDVHKNNVKEKFTLRSDLDNRLDIFQFELHDKWAEMDEAECYWGLL